MLSFDIRNDLPQNLFDSATHAWEEFREHPVQWAVATGLTALGLSTLPASASAVGIGTLVLAACNRDEPAPSVEPTKAKADPTAAVTDPSKDDMEMIHEELLASMHDLVSKNDGQFPYKFDMLTEDNLYQVHGLINNEQSIQQGKAVYDITLIKHPGTPKATRFDGLRHPFEAEVGIDRLSPGVSAQAAIDANQDAISWLPQEAQSLAAANGGQIPARFDALSPHDFKFHVEKLSTTGNGKCEFGVQAFLNDGVTVVHKAAYDLAPCDAHPLAADPK